MATQRDARLVHRRFRQRRAFSRPRLCEVFRGRRRRHRRRGRVLNTPRRGVRVARGGDQWGSSLSSSPSAL
jgi:hypothetical protein